MITNIRRHRLQNEFEWHTQDACLALLHFWQCHKVLRLMLEMR